MVKIGQTGENECPTGGETTLIGWIDTRKYAGHKSLIIDNSGSGQDVKIRVWQGNFPVPVTDPLVPTFEARIDYDFARFTVAAGAKARLPIYDDGFSEALKITGEGVGGTALTKAHLQGPAPKEVREDF